MIINPYAFGVSYDPDAQAFFTASGLTGTTNLNAINQLVLDLKSYGIWTKMKAIYPFIGGTAALHKWNLKDPQDTNAAFRLVFNGGYTHDANGIQGNGINAYADTFLNPNTVFLNNNTHISLYSRLNQQQLDCDMGSFSSSQATESSLYIFRPTNNTIYANNSSTNFFYNDINSLGNYLVTRTGTTINLFKNSLKVQASTNTATARPNFNYFISTINSNGSPNAGLYSNKQFSFCTIGDGLTDTEAANFYTAVQAYQTTLSRNV